MTQTLRLIALTAIVFAICTSVSQDTVAQPPQTDGTIEKKVEPSSVVKPVAGIQHEHVERHVFENESFTMRAKYPDNGTNYTISWTRQEVTDLPKWDSSKDNPPVSALAAISIAQTAMTKWFETFDDCNWKMTSLELVPFDSKAGDWYWSVNFNITIKKRTDKFPVAIGMDGKVRTQKDTVSIEPGVE